MFKTCFLLILVISVCLPVYPQNDINAIFDKTLSYRGLTREDITIPIEYFPSSEKSPVNDAKLLLPFVQQMMKSPLEADKYLDEFSSWDKADLYELISNISPYLTTENKNKFVKISFSTDTDALLNTIKKITDIAVANEKDLLKAYNNEELKYLQKNILSVIEESETDDPSNTDIFKFNVARDSSLVVGKRTMDMLNKLNISDILSNSISEFDLCYQLYQFVFSHKEEISEVLGDSQQEINYKGRKIAIGGKGKNRYSGDYIFIIDLGGDDVYELEGAKSIGNNFSCIIDISGNDKYSTNSNFSLGASLFSSGFIFDKEGNDVYISKTVSLGSAFCGMGLIYDEAGDDYYYGRSFSQGAACFGIGLICDRSGNDVYLANSYSQGFGMTMGFGAIVDSKGNDSYLIDARSLDIGRYEDHYLSMCQGYGLGLRPYYAGGIGLIIEGEGNDIYNTDIFGQGGAYWYSLGAIVDKSGNDKYNGYQYSQGAGIHLAVGWLKDYNGWDFYQSNGVSQGCGHDFGFGYIHDVNGYDNYSAYSLSQGAGNANGIGILFDDNGRDGYLNKDANNTRGYGNPRREYGSIGIFLDASGNDFYSNPGLDSTLVNSSLWGVFDDYPALDPPQEQTKPVADFKVNVDSSKNYTTEEYFIMAKTIEPRFSRWQDFGFRKLIDDSSKSAEYVTTKLGTNDHRETQVMRVLSTKIESALANAIIKKLDGYLAGKNEMSQPEVSFGCYIFGETKNPIGKEVLFKLTFDTNYRIRSSAINALGKIKIDNNDRDFISKVSKRLIELTNENNSRNLYNKDIAFAFKNFKDNNNISALMNLLAYNYFGVRFLASDDLKMYGDEYYNYIDESFIQTIVSKTYLLEPFLESVSNLSDIKYMTVIDKLLTYDFPADTYSYCNILSHLKTRQNISSEPGTIIWLKEKITLLENKCGLKVK
jgi:hypothetical protein